MLALERLHARRIRVCGLVQGVGFRPAVHRLATSLGLRGWVCNDGAGVLIHLEGSLADLETFGKKLSSSIPPAAYMDSMVVECAFLTGASDFCVRCESQWSEESLTTRVPADRAVCAECRSEILSPRNRRAGHAFASCIACGPRYSILRAMPYERCNTTMADFSMCECCGEEYANPRDRRFHAEPIACPECGPRLASTLSRVCTTLRQGEIVALKGLGGYQLLVRADRDDAVQRLRERKHRPTKPFAIMVGSIADAERVAVLSPAERELLEGPENPIVLAIGRGVVSEFVAPGLRRIGVMLPTTPLHVLLLAEVEFPIVATSGNVSDEPIAMDAVGRQALVSIADCVVDHDRAIERRVDDSVYQVIDDRPMAIRLARGYAPRPLPALEAWARESQTSISPMLAVGGQQKNTLALWTGHQAVVSAHLGNLGSPEARRCFSQAAKDLCGLYRSDPASLVADLHPEYYPTQWAQTAGLPLIQVQHHHAHAVACMVEHDLLDRPVLGFVFDGTGYGPDGTIWGGEILQATMADFRRLASLVPFALPGGEAAIHEPNRIALSVLRDAFGSEAIPASLLERLNLPEGKARILQRMIERGVHAPRTSSVGRLFDAVAALLLGAHSVSYEGEAASRLEEAADERERGAYSITVSEDATGVLRGDWRPMVRALVADLGNRVSIGVCAARFHNGLAEWAARMAAMGSPGDVVVGGGCFQNALLLDRTRAALLKIGKKVFVPGRIPPNDGGLAVGQLAVAMARAGR